MMDKRDNILVTGSDGMVGSLLVSELKRKGFENIIECNRENVDLRNQDAVNKFFEEKNPDIVFALAAKVGGIMANIQSPSDFLYDNIMISFNVIHASYRNNVKKLLNLGSSCIYPRECKQPMNEEYLLGGKLEPTNEGYSIAKISSIKLCEYYNKTKNCNFISIIPPNLYGPKDNFSDSNAHVISSLIRKFHKAKLRQDKIVNVWGTGKARREFLFNLDLVDGIIFAMMHYNSSNYVNMGFGVDFTIKELAILISKTVGFEGQIRWDKEKPDGMPLKLLDSTLFFNMGWEPSVNLETGLSLTYQWYKESLE